MLEFFRRYQRYIYFVVTFCVVISFSFFGTFNVMPSLQSHHMDAFRAVNGQQMSSGDVEELALFLSSDNDDKLFSGGSWGPNFLNDGVIRKDILETGIGAILVDRFGSFLSDELQNNLEREKRFQPYQNPSAPFMSAANVWSYYAPEIVQQLALLQGQEQALDATAFEQRVALYLAEHSFPAPFLQQVLLQQQRQYSWLKPDSELPRTDLSLFGYHSLSDWFGKRFLRLTAEFIINSAIQAEEMGYEVSRTEALAELMRNATVSFQQQHDNPRLGVASVNEYFRQQLNRMGLDQNRAVWLWRQVLLFRRLYGDYGAIALIDRSPFKGFEDYAHETAQGTFYSVPKPLQLANFKALERLEAYFRAVSAKRKDKMLPPTEFLSVERVAKKAPYLVQKRYLIDVAEIDRRSLEGKISVKQMWEWQTSDAHWPEIEAELPLLGTKKATTVELRYAALDELDSATRDQLNKKTMDAMIDAHPEWISEALAHAKSEQKSVGITLEGKQEAFQGVGDPQELIALLDDEKGSDRLEMYSGNGSTYYRIKVLERSGAEILTFADALSRGALDDAISKELQALYVKVREALPGRYRTSDGTWKPFELVRDEIAKDFYASTKKAVRADAIEAGVLTADAPPLSDDRVASLRLLKYVGIAKAQVEAGTEPTELSPLQAQWQLEKRNFTTSRAEADRSVNREVAFGMSVGAWSAIDTPLSGLLGFFHLENKGVIGSEEALRARVQTAQERLAREAKKELALELTSKMADKQAINLDFLGKARAEEVINLPISGD